MGRLTLRPRVACRRTPRRRQSGLLQAMDVSLRFAGVSRRNRWACSPSRSPRRSTSCGSRSNPGEPDARSPAKSLRRTIVGSRSHRKVEFEEVDKRSRQCCTRRADWIWEVRSDCSSMCLRNRSPAEATDQIAGSYPRSTEAPPGCGDGWEVGSHLLSRKRSDRGARNLTPYGSS